MLAIALHYHSYPNGAESAAEAATIRNHLRAPIIEELRVACVFSVIGVLCWPLLSGMIAWCLLVVVGVVGVICLRGTHFG